MSNERNDTSAQTANPNNTAIIIGAGPAGLTAAYELLDKTDIIPVIFEMSDDIGGISKTVNYRGNRIDIGGHRFFSKSEKIMQWWLNILPLQGKPARDDLLLNRKVPLATKSQKRPIGEKEPIFSPSPDPELVNLVMLVRSRMSRIFFMRKLFDYPVSLTLKTLLNLGLVRLPQISLSYIKARLSPVRPEKSLEDFFINRFGRELYQIFFKGYTEKVWGAGCREISAEWGAQRIKGLSLTKTIVHSLRQKVMKPGDYFQHKQIETSLAEQFLYPKLGPGQLWEEVALLVEKKGGIVIRQATVVGIETKSDRVVAVQVRDVTTGTIKRHNADYFFSTMPVKELIDAMGSSAPEKVSQVASGLRYRDFMTVGLLLKKLKIKNETSRRTINDLIPDNWIYIQERDVKLGRLQIFNNWSPYMVNDPDTVWLGLEYFCTEGDSLWSMGDDNFIRFAIDELASIGIIDPEDILDATVLRMPKAYPAYFGSYNKFDTIREFTDGFSNLFLIGRNGMHRYNNADHSMLTAMVAVENIIAHRSGKDNIWQINTEQEYQEGL